MIVNPEAEINLEQNHEISQSTSRRNLSKKQQKNSIRIFCLSEIRRILRGVV